MTASSILGFLPLVASSGAGSELYRGMGAVQLGGMALSTVFTLILVPTMFSLWMDARSGLLTLLGRKPKELNGNGHGNGHHESEVVALTYQSRSTHDL
jgi:HAE1 family hydrophobic/amphiphilic exporter-1